MGVQRSRQEVVLLEKNRPQQQRAIKTYESILTAASELLAEVGLERISTNLIAERAGITVPALYRYFPNKYAVLNALGARLMDRQNQVFLDWHEEFVAGRPPESLFNHLHDLLYRSYIVTRDFPAGLEIMHGMQVMAPLQEVRLDSHWAMAELFGHLWCEQFGAVYTADIARRARFAVDLGFMTVQMALEDRRLIPEEVVREGAAALRLYLEFTAREAGVGIDQG